MLAGGNMPYLHPLNLIRKKMNSWAPDFPADSSQFFQSPRLHECGPADAHGNAQPFCMDKCIFRKKRLFCNLATRWNKILQLSHHFLSMDGWPGDAIFSCRGEPLKIIHKNSAKKGPAPWILFLPPAPRPLQVTFFWLVKLNICGLYPFARTNAFSAKNICFVIWARVDTKFLISSHHVLSVDDWPGDATFFLWGQPWRSSASIQSKKVQPLEFYFWHVRLGSWSHLFWLVKLNICGCNLLQGQMHFQQKTYVL